MKLFTTLAAAGVTAFAVLLPAAADDMPLNIFSVPFWKEFPVVREASAADIAKPARAVYLELHDMDDFNECAIFVNDLGPLDPPADCLSDSDNMPGMIELPAGWLRAGDNKISFYRTGDCNGSTKGFTVNNVKLLFASNRSGLEKQYEELKKKLPLPSGLMSYSRPLAIRNTFTDNFNDCAPGSEFPYWMNMRGDWQVVERDGEKFISCVKAAPESQLLLHVYGQDSTFSGRFRVDSATKESGLYILGRCNAYPDWMVRAGYDYSRGVWQIAESFHVQRNYDFPSVAPEPGVWHDFELKFSGRQVTLKVDGKVVASCDNLLNSNYGRTGFLADNLTADFDDLKLVSEGVPMDGVKEWVLGARRGGYAGNLNIVRLDDGRLLMHYNGDGGVNGKVCRESFDDGKTWSQPINDPFGNAFGVIGIEKLADGRFIAMRYQWKDNNSPADIFARVSTPGGEKWGNEFNLSRGGINVAMNGKITQVSNGRIFIPACKAAGFEGEKTGGMTVHYSDDAVNWHRIKKDLDRATTGMNLQEGQIVELDGGKLMMVMRCEKPYLCASYSDDNGESWSDPEPLPLPSVMCAFGIRRAKDTGEIYVFWTFDDTTQVPNIHQYPRERVALAVSRDNAKTWQFLGDIDAFGGYQGRFMNLALFIEGKNLYLTSTVFKFDKDKRVVVKLWRIERDKLKPYPEFPPLH